MIVCKGGGIYTGIAKDVEDRYQKHVSGKGARYTKMNPPIALLSKQQYSTRREAAQTEWMIKQMSPADKRQWAFAMSGCVLESWKCLMEPPSQ